MHTEKTKLVSNKFKERPGHVTTKKIRAVCIPCNNGWMSIVESAAQPIAGPMILGNAITLTPPMQTILAQWLTLKIMLGEQNQRHQEIKEIVIPQDDRDEFRRSRTIPSYICIWIARYVALTWRHAYLRHAALIGIGGSKTVIPPNTRGKNIQTTALGIGELFTYAIACTTDGIDFREFIRVGRAFTQLWPLTGDDISWPPPVAIDDRGANGAANVLASIMADDTTRWGGDAPEMR